MRVWVLASGLRARDEPRGDALEGVAGDREADAGRLRVAELGVGGRERGDPDDPAAQVDECPAGVPGVYRGGCLDHGRKRDAIALFDGATERRDDALGDARAQS